MVCDRIYCKIRSPNNYSFAWILVCWYDRIYAEYKPWSGGQCAMEEVYAIVLEDCRPKLWALSWYKCLFLSLMKMEFLDDILMISSHSWSWRSCQNLSMALRCMIAIAMMVCIGLTMLKPRYTTIYISVTGSILGMQHVWLCRITVSVLQCRRVFLSNCQASIHAWESILPIIAIHSMHGASNVDIWCT